MADLDTWDVAAANNNSAPPDGWPEGMQYSAVNNSARENMAALARFWKDFNGELQFAGSVNAYTVTLNSSYAAYFQGMRFSAEINITNTGATTVNVNAIGAQSVVTRGGTALPAGILVAGGVYEFVYDGTNFQFMGSIEAAADLGATSIEISSVAGVDLSDAIAPLVISPGTGQHLEFDWAEIQSKSDATTAAVLHLNRLGGEVRVGNVAVALQDVNIIAGTGLTGGGLISASRTLNLDTGNSRNADHSAISITAGTGMSGGGTIAATRSLGLDTAHSRNVDHSAVSVSAGVGLSGGGTIAATRTLTVDLNGLTDMGVNALVGTDYAVVIDGTGSRKISIDDIRIPLSAVDNDAHTLLSTEMNSIKAYGGVGGHNWALNTGVILSGQFIMIINDGTGNGPTITGTATVESASGFLTVKENGVAVIACFATDKCKISGDLVA